MGRRGNPNRDKYGRFSSTQGGSGKAPPKRSAAAQARAAASPGGRRKAAGIVKGKGTLAARTSLKNSKAKLAAKNTSAQRGAVKRGSNKLKDVKKQNKTSLTSGAIANTLSKRKGLKPQPTLAASKSAGRKVNLRAQRAKAMADRTGVVSGKNFEDGKAVKTLSLREMRKAVMDKYKGGGKGTMEFIKLQTGLSRMPQTRSEWDKAYRTLVELPKSDRNRKARPGIINGVDIQKNFRPWVVFRLNPNTATRADINKAFKDVARKTHPDLGGRAKDFERVKKMRDTLLALMPDDKPSKGGRKKSKVSTPKSAKITRPSGPKLLPPGK